MRLRPSLPVLLLAILVAGGCHTTERITDRQALLEAVRERDKLDVLLADSSLLQLVEYQVIDSALEGRGTRLRDGVQTPFEGTVPMTQIRYIERRQGVWFSTVLALGGAGYVIGSALSILNEESASGFEIRDEVILYDPRRINMGSSCPTLYAWDGADFRLEGEAFAVAWGSAMEMTTRTLLPSLRPNGELLLVQVRNERPETHYHNTISVLTAEVPEAAAVVTDTRNRLVQLDHPVGPAAVSGALPGEGRQVLTDVDGRYWESDRSTAYPGGSYRDRLEMTFSTASTDPGGVLIVTAINSEIFSVMLEHLAGLLGDASLHFVSALENDPEMIRLMRTWLDEAALQVRVSDGSTWRDAGRILPEANAVPFTRAIPLALDGMGDSVVVRLECLADVWKIDAVALDRSPVHVIPWSPTACLSTQLKPDRDVSHIVRAQDSTYVMALPGDVLEVCVRRELAGPGMRRVYALEATGYLHEWMPAHRGTVLTSFVSREDRVKHVKTLLHHRGLLLPPIYARWAQAMDAH